MKLLPALLLLLIGLSCAGATPSVVGKWKDVDGNTWEFTADKQVVGLEGGPVNYAFDAHGNMLWTFTGSLSTDGVPLVMTHKVAHAGDTLTLTLTAATGLTLQADDREPMVLNRMKQ